ncbi:type II toxin-antitoxin system RelE/ParE family toxin [Duganella dendranthematis]|jgi:putative addiction module killer protein|uniref:Type II toxin-antitoxin system RelE/ParE family toxin n=2 Tax=Duganella dendranthematis TaxID=2728021 RepID=A0ABX6MJK2_9BURK|nr:type II toxin-antitoxin system RelE/ParE family toxin [Duganella dendranthematis]
MEIRRYTRADLSVPFQQWFDHLDKLAAAKVSRALFRMGDGNLSRVKWFASIGEYVIDWGPGYRIYLAKDGAMTILLLGGGTKKHQQIDITRAKLMHEEFKRRKKETGGGLLWS